METITSQLKNMMAPKAGSGKKFNKMGNCPEFLGWGVVCHEEGKDIFICFTMDDDSKAKIYRCCDSCEDMLRLLGANKIEIEDL